MPEKLIRRMLPGGKPELTGRAFLVYICGTSREEPDQAGLFTLIKSIKAGWIGEAQRIALIATGKRLPEQGAQAFAVACTGLSVIAPQKNALPFVDASQAPAEETVAIIKRGKVL